MLEVRSKVVGPSQPTTLSAPLETYAIIANVIKWAQYSI